MTARLALAAALLLAGGTARAEVLESSPSGFQVRHAFTVAAPPAAAWNAVARPGEWWPKAHTWSGDASKLSLELVAGGCFCERWSGGSAAHGRVLMVRERELLRMDAPLGPLQEMGLDGLLTVTLEAAGEGTNATVTFRVRGDASQKLDQLAPVVDAVVGEQWGNWKSWTEQSVVPKTPLAPDVN
ncbi:MAG TPA: SRPBCC family protein [Xanthomonadales bacterium]|nr:SRPBCC family protein [Xanthomonadales bacterium]